MKFFISLLILKAQKRQTTFWIYQDNEYFVIINDRILLLKLSLRKNAANYFKDQRRHSICLAHVSWDTLYYSLWYVVNPVISYQTYPRNTARDM